MGIDFSHGNARWSYGGFNSFRLKLGKEIGMDLDLMDGFKVGGTPWPPDESDGILPLLNHSDCDGELTVEECKVVAPRLRELIASWPDYDYDKNAGNRLANAMDEAVAAGEPLVFC